MTMKTQRTERPSAHHSREAGAPRPQPAAGPVQLSLDGTGASPEQMERLGDAVVQLRAAIQSRARGPEGGGGAEHIRRHAAEGLRGGGGPLPYADQIQASFGPHDVSHVQAHTGGEAQRASEAIGAQAYASGNHVAFRGQPDLHTAAHEAAHVVQQRDGVQLSDGVGRAGDSYEQHADAVADRVVRGQSATDLLGGASSGGSGGARVQMVEALVSSDRNTDRHRRGASMAGNPDFEEDGYTYWNAEMDRQEDWGNEAVGEYAEQVASTDVAGNLPQPKPAYLGYPAYYEFRRDDFLRRHPRGTVPDYYMSYGYVYANRFTNELFPKLSNEGKRWVVRTRTYLQLAFENAILADAEAFDRLESNPDELRDFAFDSHPQAYLDGGLRDLPMGDHWHIVMTPDLGDILSLDGLAQILDIAPGMILEYGQRTGQALIDGGFGQEDAETGIGMWDMCWVAREVIPDSWTDARAYITRAAPPALTELYAQRGRALAARIREERTVGEALRPAFQSFAAAGAALATTPIAPPPVSAAHIEVVMQALQSVGAANR